MRIDQTLLIGENEHYQFFVGRMGDRWIGFAVGDLEGGDRLMCVFPEIADRYQLGLVDRDEAIRRTGAIACDVESSYGGVTTWHVDEDLRGDPDSYRCATCGRICCSGDCQEDWGEDMDW